MTERLASRTRVEIRPDPCPTCGSEVEGFDIHGGRPDDTPDFGRTTLRPCGHRFATAQPIECTYWRFEFSEPIEEATS